MRKQGKVLLQNKPPSIHILYDNYAAMLLGYINEVVKDKVVAEEYLLKTFNTIAQKNNCTNWSENNNWVQLLRFAREELIPFHDSVKGYKAPAVVNINNSIACKYLDKMTTAQKHVFCSIYYNKKTTAELSREINKSEELIKTLLKEAFCIIRRLNGN
ncbi:sigma factor-like helix-turn-helix DNA-binding protein [Mucilaginibacter sp. UYCu711]|uniref:sigma factor-like helix-turn-helix DNA-binding protein n=1 Tax=Mucilaginibacter sp. UYCu711 TaxID=3156339 RepID=UPI003D1D889B